jgi:hypothetical protein
MPNRSTTLAGLPASVAAARCQADTSNDVYFSVQVKRKSLLFLKKKKQKDFYFWRCGNFPAMAWILEAAEK